MTNFDVGMEYLRPALPDSVDETPEVPYWFWPPLMDFVPTAWEPTPSIRQHRP
jgi:hypothetical protein